MTRDNSTVTQSQTGRNLGRRAFISGLGATAAGAGAISLEGGPVQESKAIAPLLLAGAVGVAAGAAGSIAYGATLGGPDESEVASALDWQAHVQEYTRAREDSLLLEQTLASLDRDIQLVENKAREQAIFKIYEAGVDGLSQSDATTAAEAAINDAYATVERAILQSWNVRANRGKTIAQNMGGSGAFVDFNDSTQYPGDLSGLYTLTEDSGAYAVNSHTLLNGENMDLTGATSREGDLITVNSPLDTRTDSSTYTRMVNNLRVTKPDPTNYSVSETAPEGPSNVVVLKSDRWYALREKLLSKHTTMLNEVSSMVSSYFTPAQNGEISLNEAVGPKYLTDSAKTARDYEEAAQALRAMGYPLSNQKVTVEIPTESGGTMEVIGRLAWTAHNGNGLVVGQTLNFQNFPGSLMAAVNTPEGQRDSSTEYPGAEQIEITGEFTITTAEGASEVTFTDRSLAEADATTNSEIQKIYEENQDANQRATDTVKDTVTSGGGSGGGGGFLDFGGGDSRTLGLIAGGAAILLLLANNDDE